MHVRWHALHAHLQVTTDVGVSWPWCLDSQILPVLVLAWPSLRFLLGAPRGWPCHPFTFCCCWYQLPHSREPKLAGELSMARMGLLCHPASPGQGLLEAPVLIWDMTGVCLALSSVPLSAPPSCTQADTPHLARLGLSWQLQQNP